VHAVRDLAGHPDHDRPDRRDVDLDVLVVVPRRRPLLGEQAQLVVGPSCSAPSRRAAAIEASVARGQHRRLKERGA